MTENDLRKLISKSQRDGFKALFQQYKNYVYMIVWERIRRVGTVEDAEECVSDVFADIFIHFGEIKENMLQAYIITASERTAIDKYRSLRSRQGKRLSDNELSELPDDTDIADKTENAEQGRILFDAIISLGEPDSTILIQKYYYARNAKDIAETVGLSHGNVRARLKRALKKLEKILAEKVQ